MNFDFAKICDERVLLHVMNWKTDCAIVVT